jgi:hypothetical protein
MMHGAMRVVITVLAVIGALALVVALAMGIMHFGMSCCG